MPLASAKFEMRSDSGEESDTSESSVESDTSEESGSNSLGDSGSLSSVDLGKNLNIDSDKEADDLLDSPRVSQMVNAIEKSERKAQEEARLARQKKVQEAFNQEILNNRIQEEETREKAHIAREKEAQARAQQEAQVRMKEARAHKEASEAQARAPEEVARDPESSSSRIFKPEVYKSPLHAHKVNRPCQFSDAERCIGISGHGRKCHNKGKENGLCSAHIEMQEDAPIKKRRDSLQAKVKA